MCWDNLLVLFFIFIFLYMVFLFGWIIYFIYLFAEHALLLFLNNLVLIKV